MCHLAAKEKAEKAIRAHPAVAELGEQAGLAELAKLAELGGVGVATDHARIRTFFRSVSGRSQCS